MHQIKRSVFEHLWTRKHALVTYQLFDSQKTTMAEVQNEDETMNEAENSSSLTRFSGLLLYFMLVDCMYRIFASRYIVEPDLFWFSTYWAASQVGASIVYFAILGVLCNKRNYLVPLLLLKFTVLIDGIVLLSSFATKAFIHGAKGIPDDATYKQEIFYFILLIKVWFDMKK